MLENTLPRLAVGEAAPIFQTTDIFGNEINLEALRGHPVLLSFYRYSSCSVCNFRVHKLITKYPEYQAKGLAIIAVFESPVENIRQYVGKQDAPFPIIADPQTRLYDLYGVETSEAKVQASLQNTLTQTVAQSAVAQGYPLMREDGGNFNRMPADFLIDADGIIRDALYSEIIGEHLPLERIEAIFEG